MTPTFHTPPLRTPISNRLDLRFVCASVDAAFGSCIFLFPLFLPPRVIVPSERERRGEVSGSVTTKVIRSPFLDSMAAAECPTDPYVDSVTKLKSCNRVAIDFWIY